MTEYTEDDFKELIDELNSKRFYSIGHDEVAEACVELANEYVKYTGAGDSSIKAAALYAACRLQHVHGRRKDIADMCGVSTATISRNWRQMVEVAVRKDSEIDMDSERLLEII